MDIEKFYREINGDYENTLKRLCSKNLIERFIGEFLKDPTFNNLCAAFENNDIENAFLAAHTLKGICANLGLLGLQKESSELTEILRNRTFDNSQESFEKVKDEYEKIRKAVN